MKQISGILNIRDKDTLTSDQVDFIRGTSLGIMAPFYWLARHMWAFTILWVVSARLFSIFAIFLFAILTYVAWRHCRRWSWNVNRWDDFVSFKKSEQRWRPWGVVGVILFVILWLTWWFILPGDLSSL